MCTQDAPNDVTVCDIAIADVKTALRGVPGVTYEHRPNAGTRVVNTQREHDARFRKEVTEAIARHGGTLPPGA